MSLDDRSVKVDPKGFDLVQVESKSCGMMIKKRRRNIDGEPQGICRGGCQ